MFVIFTTTMIDKNMTTGSVGHIELPYVLMSVV